MFITEMELLQARLAAGKRLNDSHILKEILQEDRSSEKKRRMAEGERYYRGEHDSLQKDFRRSPISETKENGEEELRMFLTRTEATTIAYTRFITHWWRRKRRTSWGESRPSA